MDYEDDLDDAPVPSTSLATTVNNDFSAQVLGEKEAEELIESKEEHQINEATVEDSDDEGEVHSDEDADCEDGELLSEEGDYDGTFSSEMGSYSSDGVESPPGPVCHFFMRGTCEWGVGCRLRHPRSPRAVRMARRRRLRSAKTAKAKCATVTEGEGVVVGSGAENNDSGAEEDQEDPNMLLDETPWERGLRLAKARMRAAKRKKQQEAPLLEEKKLTLRVKEDSSLLTVKESAMSSTGVPPTSANVLSLDANGSKWTTGDAKVALMDDEMFCEYYSAAASDLQRRRFLPDNLDQLGLEEEGEEDAPEVVTEWGEELREGTDAMGRQLRLNQRANSLSSVDSAMSRSPTEFPQHNRRGRPPGGVHDRLGHYHLMGGYQPDTNHRQQHRLWREDGGAGGAPSGRGDDWVDMWDRRGRTVGRGTGAMRRSGGSLSSGSRLSDDGSSSSSSGSRSSSSSSSSSSSYSTEGGGVEGKRYDRDNKDADDEGRKVNKTIWITFPFFDAAWWQLKVGKWCIGRQYS